MYAAVCFLLACRCQILHRAGACGAALGCYVRVSVLPCCATTPRRLEMTTWSFSVRPGRNDLCGAPHGPPVPVIAACGTTFLASVLPHRSVSSSQGCARDRW